MSNATAEADRRRLVKHQIKSLILSLPACPDGVGGVACPDCVSEAIADVVVTFIQTGDLAR